MVPAFYQFGAGVCTQCDRIPLFIIFGAGIAIETAIDMLFPYR